jgi:hypothetical protein
MFKRVDTINEEISYDFSERIFMFVCIENKNIAQYYLMSKQEKDSIIKLTDVELTQKSNHHFVILMI